MNLPSVPQDPENEALATTAEDPRATRLFKLLHRLAANEFQAYEHAQVFEFPFFVTEDIIREMWEEVDSALSQVPVSEPTEFQGETRFEDLSSQRFNDFETFLARAGKRRDPERVVLIWRRFAITDIGEPLSGEVQIRFETEKRLHTQKREPDQINRAAIELKVSGSDQKWVDQTFDDLIPYIETTKQGGILRPLWLFRSEWFVRITSILISYVGFLIGTNLVQKLFSRGIVLEQSQILNSIITTPDVGEKLNQYATWTLTPANSPWWTPFAVIAAGALSFGILFLTLSRLLPKLTPNSAIAIGLANRRAQVYLDTFKFTVFALLVSGVLLPIIVEIVKWLF